MILQRGQTYWYNFTWSIKQRNGSSSLFWFGDRRARKLQPKPKKSNMSTDARGLGHTLRERPHGTSRA
jgi:hypothetical protein